MKSLSGSILPNPCASVQGIDGDLNKLKLTTLTAELPGALGLFARGELTHLTDSLLRGGDITLEAETKDLKFVSTLAEGIEIPYGTRLEGKFTMAGTKMGTDLLLMQPEAQAVVCGRYYSYNGL